MPEKKKRITGLAKGPLAQFGEDVRRTRLARGLTLKGLGRGAGFSESHVCKVETGVTVPSPRFAAGCDRTFGTGDLFARQLKRVTEGEYPNWFAPYIDAEREAARIRDFSTLFVMGLLQTPDYARVTLTAGKPYAPEDLAAKVTSRMLRREVLERPEPPDVWVVLCEAALWSRMGSANIMAEQMRHMLAMLGQHPTLTVQVLPFSATEVGIDTAYVLLETAEGKPHVYVEGPQGGRAYHAPEAVSNAVSLYDQIRAASLSPADSAEYIDFVRSEHERNAVGPVQLQRPARGKLRRVGPGARVRRRGPGAGQ